MNKQLKAGLCMRLKGLRDRDPRRFWVVLILGAALVLVVGLTTAQAVAAPADTSTTSGASTSSTAGAPTNSSTPAGPVQTHTNAGVPGTSAPFSLQCDDCHQLHNASSADLLPASVATICAQCHDLSNNHADPATQQAVAASPAPGDCVSCHPHSSGFMPVAAPVPLTVKDQSTGYDDLDGSGDLSPGDRVHYRIDYSNPGPYQVTGVTLGDTPDATHVLSVEAISDAGTFDGTAIKWNIGTLAAGASGFVTYDVVLKDASSFGGTTPAPTNSTSTTSTTVTTAATTDSTATSSSTTTTATSTSTVDSPTTTDTTATAGDPSTSTTLATSTAATVDVANTVTLMADNRQPVAATATVTVAVGGSSATTPTTSATTDTTATTGGTTTTDSTSTTDSTTTTTLSTTDTSAVVQPSTTPTTIPPVYAEVASMSSLTADARRPLTASATVSVLVSGSPSTTPTTTPTTSSPTIVLNPFALTLTQQAVGYDDLDKDGYLSPGDRVHYRIDYSNPGLQDATGVALNNVLDTAHVASLGVISGNGKEVDDPEAQIPTAVQWNIGTLPAGTSGFVTYDVVLRSDIVMVSADWAFPVQGPNHYYDDFGAPRYVGGYHTHTGNDIMCARGTPLVAVVSGVVTRANRVDQGLGGRTIFLRGDDGNSYYYAHLSMIQPGIDDGVRVAMGQVVGFAGNTGDAAGGPVHLHFSIYPGGGAAVDPYLVLKGVATVAEVAALGSTTTTASSSTTTTTIGATTTTLPPDTTTTLPPVTDTTTTTTTLPPVTDTTTTTTPPVTDTTTTTALDTTTTTAAPTTTTTASTPST